MAAPVCGIKRVLGKVAAVCRVSIGVVCVVEIDGGSCLDLRKRDANDKVSLTNDICAEIDVVITDG